MSKITNDGVTRSVTGCFIAAYPCGNSGRRRVNRIAAAAVDWSIYDPQTWPSRFIMVVAVVKA